MQFLPEADRLVSHELPSRVLGRTSDRRCNVADDKTVTLGHEPHRVIATRRLEIRPHPLLQISVVWNLEQSGIKVRIVAELDPGAS